MKFLTFSDVHEDKVALQELLDRAREDDVDFIVTAGDISTFGRGLRPLLEDFKKIGKKFYIVPGNHESSNMLDKLIPDYPNCINIHRQAVEIENYIFLGYGEGGFTLTTPDFRKVAREWYGKYNGKKIVLVTHQPPYGTKLDLLHETQVGNKDFRKFIERIKPKLSISGHLHETAGMVDKVLNTKCVNPGWDGMVIELK